MYNGKGALWALPAAHRFRKYSPSDPPNWPYQSLLWVMGWDTQNHLENKVEMMDHVYKIRLLWEGKFWKLKTSLKMSICFKKLARFSKEKKCQY